ncbi:hypothetical protein Q1695_014013 [Nippostrongylus brasiliensis]|nr:hypothetical protein Q1695_014013 [Nippostrongylus brasiliensis]
MSSPLLTVVSVALFATFVDAHERVLLKDVSTITLREGQYTTGRRSNPVPQLRCVGGSAKGKYQPRAAQCFKQGFDGSDYQWRCTADMPEEFEFGEITVTCEGFSYPEDPYILKGSCGLEYDLEYAHSTKVGRKKSSTWSSWSSWLTTQNFANACVIAFIFYVIYTMIYSPRGSSHHSDPRRGGFGGGFDGGPGFGGGGYPGMHPPPSAPPSYDDTMGFKSGAAPSNAQSGGSGPGFWTGAGLGALGGYLFGRNQGPTLGGYDTFGSTRRRNIGFMRDTGFDNDYDADQPSTSTGIRESTGFGGTRRR